MSGVIPIAVVAVLCACTPAAPQDRPLPTLIADLEAGEPDVRARAACELRARGDEAADAGSALVAMLSDAAPVDVSVCGRRWWQGRDRTLTTPGELAASALVSLGSRTVPMVLPVLKSPVWAARRNAVWTLGALHEESAVPALIDALKDPEPLVREQAAWALGAIRDERAIDPLLAALKDAYAGVRRQSAWAIGVIGK